jgi:hypothetical protein
MVVFWLLTVDDGQLNLLLSVTGTAYSTLWDVSKGLLYALKLGIRRTHRAWSRM